MAEILPDTRGHKIRVLFRDHTTGHDMCEATCFSCPRTTIVSVDPLGGDFAFYACPDCEAKYLKSADVVPMNVFAERVVQAQLEDYGRILSPHEALIELDDPTSAMSLIARDRPGKKAS